MKNPAKAKSSAAAEPEARKFHHGHLREALLQRLLEVLDAEGMEGIGVRRLARDLEVDPASVYRHFRDMNALHGAAAEACFAAFAGVMERAAHKGESGDDASPHTQLIRTGEAYVRYVSAHPHRFRLMFGGANGPGALPRAEATGPSGQTAWEVWLSVVKRGLPEGVDAALEARVAWSMVHGVAALTIHGPLAGLGAAEQRRLLRRALEIVADATVRGDAKRDSRS